MYKVELSKIDMGHAKFRAETKIELLEKVVKHLHTKNPERFAAMTPEEKESLKAKLRDIVEEN